MSNISKMSVGKVNITHKSDTSQAIQSGNTNDVRWLDKL